MMHNCLGSPIVSRCNLIEWCNGGAITLRYGELNLGLIYKVSIRCPRVPNRQWLSELVESESADGQCSEIHGCLSILEAES
jgi:hypothetical protein